MGHRNLRDAARAESVNPARSLPGGCRAEEDHLQRHSSAFPPGDKCGTARSCGKSQHSETCPLLSLQTQANLLHFQRTPLGATAAPRCNGAKLSGETKAPEITHCCCDLVPEGLSHLDGRWARGVTPQHRRAPLAEALLGRQGLKDPTRLDESPQPSRASG